jgi:hypothetical protein
MATIVVNKDTVLPKRHAFDFYRTPEGLVESAMNEIAGHWLPHIPRMALDPGAGDGVWGKWVKHHLPKTTLIGVELRGETIQPEWYDVWVWKSFLDYQPAHKFQLIVGNPPYKHAEDFVQHGLELLHPDSGVMVFLFKTSFLESIGRWERLFQWSEKSPTTVYQLPRRVSFSGDGKTNAEAYAVFEWNNYMRKNSTDTRLRWLGHNNDMQFNWEKDIDLSREQRLNYEYKKRIYRGCSSTN